MPDVPRLVEAGRKAYSHLSIDDAMGLWSDFYNKRQAAWKAKDINDLLRWSMGALPLTERYLEHIANIDKITGDRTEDSYCKSIYYACRFLPHIGARGQLENVRELVDFFPQLRLYRESVELAFQSIETIKAIRAYLKDNPGTKQNRIKKALNYEDGRHLSLLIKDMETMGQLERRKSGNTYELYLQAKPVPQASSKQSQKEKPRKVEDVPITKAPPKKKLFSWWKRS